MEVLSSYRAFNDFEQFDASLRDWPQNVFVSFVELFVDSANWVMVPHVYGMGQFSDGGLFATKPYICGSNYLVKMSDYNRDDSSIIIDGLYWRFIDKKSISCETAPLTHDGTIFRKNGS